MFIITQIDNQDKRKKERKVMLLVELLEVVDENRNMVVFDEDRVVSVYDGRDSIDKTLNNRIVATVDCRNNEFHVFLK